MTAQLTRWRDVLGRLAAALASRGEQGWLVGGCLRDAVLGRPVYDLDVAIAGDPLAVAHALVPPGTPGAAVVRLGRQTVRVVLATAPQRPALQIDLSRLRGTTIDEDLRARDFTANAMALPLATLVAWAPLLEAAEAATSHHSGPGPAAVAGLLDPLGGLADLRAGVLRAASASALVADPLRVLRGVRLGVQLGLAFDVATIALARAAVPGLRLEAPARLRDELWAMLRLAQAPAALSLLQELGAFAAIFPEYGPPAEHARDATIARAEHAIRALAALDAALKAVGTTAIAGTDTALARAMDAWFAEPQAAGRSRWLTLRWAVLLHALPSPAACSDAAPDTATVPLTGTAPSRTAQADLPAPPAPAVVPGAVLAVAKRMGLAARERAVVGAVVTHRALAERVMRCGPVEEREARQFFAHTGEAGVDVVLAALACACAEGGLALEPVGHDPVLDQARALIAFFFTARDTVIPPPFIDGRVLIEEVGVQPGPAVGKLLARVRAAQVDGAISTRAEALRLARALHSPG